MQVPYKANKNFFLYLPWLIQILLHLCLICSTFQTLQLTVEGFQQQKQAHQSRNEWAGLGVIRCWLTSYRHVNSQWQCWYPCPLQNIFVCMYCEQAQPTWQWQHCSVFGSSTASLPPYHRKLNWAAFIGRFNRYLWAFAGELKENCKYGFTDN